MSHNTFDLAIGGMSCSACSNAVEKCLLKLPGVEAVEVNFATEKARVHLKDSTHQAPSDAVPTLIQAVTQAGYEAQLIQAGARTSRTSFAMNVQSPWEIGLAAALTLPLIMPMVLMSTGIHWMLSPFQQWLLATPVQFVLGRRFYKAAWQALKNGSTNMDVLVTLGTWSAYGLSLWMWKAGEHELYFESAASVLTFVMLGKWLEGKAKRQTRADVEAMADLQPHTAHLLKNAQVYDIPIEQVAVGDVVLVKPGESVPVDGLVVQGQAHLNEAALTGESMPVYTEVNHSVKTGSINVDGHLHVQATAVGAHTFLSQLLQVVDNTQANKPQIQRLVDHISEFFVPTVMILSFMTTLVWGIYLKPGDWQTAIVHAVSVLVIACPCALGLATPTALVVGSGLAARRGILFRNPQALEEALRIDTVVFDKTGTLTKGQPELMEIIASEGVEPSTLLHIAAQLEAGSQHPIAQAIVKRAQTESIPKSVSSTLTDFQDHAGRGISAQINGKHYALGTGRWMTELGVSEFAIEKLNAQLPQGARSLAYLSIQNEQGHFLMGLLTLGDPLRQESVQAVAQLHQQQRQVMMLTGDSFGAAQAVAEQLGIDQVMAEQLPQDKATVIQSLQRQGHRVAMMGDGVNDAPALATADLSMAMASGTDLAMQTADITLMHNDPRLLATALEIAQATRQKIRQNLFWAFIYNAVGLPLAASGVLSPMLAGAAMALSSVSVVANSLLLKAHKSR